MAWTRRKRTLTLDLEGRRIVLRPGDTVELQHQLRYGVGAPRADAAVTYRYEWDGEVLRRSDKVGS